MSGAEEKHEKMEFVRRSHFPPRHYGHGGGEKIRGLEKILCTRGPFVDAGTKTRYIKTRIHADGRRSRRMPKDNQRERRANKRGDSSRG